MSSIQLICTADDCGTIISEKSKYMLCRKHRTREKKHGHWSIILPQSARVTHGLSHLPEFRVWSSMKSRCLNPHSTGYHNYGGRGIKICDRWLNSFENFYADMGKRTTPKHEIDRIDNDGDYEPSNCKWSTKSEQGYNRRSHRSATSGYRGVIRTKNGEKWAANIQRYGKTTYIGTYDTPEKASQAYEARKAIFLQENQRQI